MNWDGRVRDHAEHTGINAGTVGLVQSLAQKRWAVRWAKWQRDQLRTDEAVERAAEGMYDSDRDCGPSWTDCDDSIRREYRVLARAAIAVLIGEA